jgi:hypothetical protein
MNDALAEKPGTVTSTTALAALWMGDRKVNRVCSGRPQSESQ